MREWSCLLYLSFNFVSRLCSVEELKADEASSTGCGYNGLQVWSYSTCSGVDSSGQAFEGHSTSVGSGYEDCREDTSATLVRCCADFEECPSLTCSASTCTSLGWNGILMTDNGSPGICGATNDLGLNSTGPECSGEKTWDEAVDICMDHGARLCTADELGVDDETKGTGCSYDTQRSWSLTSCGTHSYIAAFGSSAYIAVDPVERGPKCLPHSNASVFVRCCADEYSCSPTSVYILVMTFYFDYITVSFQRCSVCFPEGSNITSDAVSYAASIACENL
jgi:hypothetical protein